MHLIHEDLVLQTPGRGTQDITRRVREVVRRSGVHEGQCTIFIHHTSASLVITENADPDVQTDLAAFLSRLVPDGDPLYVHTCEGPDDMPSHVRSALTQTSITLPVRRGSCDLGTWQGVFLWEHREAPHRRRLTISVLGNPPAET